MQIYPTHLYELKQIASRLFSLVVSEAPYDHFLRLAKDLDNILYSILKSPKL